MKLSRPYSLCSAPRQSLEGLYAITVQRAWIFGIVAAGLALIASFGFGRISEIDRNKKRSTSRSNSSESSPQEQTYTDNVTAEMEETVR